MFKDALPGLLFAILWATGAVAAKFGIRSADALMLASVRFLATGFIFAPYFLIHKKYRFMPLRQEWKSITIYGFFNTTLTLGSFFAAQKYASAGISLLFTAVSPLLMVLFSAVVLKRKLSRVEIIGIVMAFTGLMVAAIAALPAASITPLGFVLLMIYMIAYAAGSMYYSMTPIKLAAPVFNIWQVFIGGLLLLPFCVAFKGYHIRHFDKTFILSLIWLIVLLSIVANQLWLYLIKRDAVSAATWLYLVPVLGYVYGYVLFDETITVYSAIGVVMVIGGLAVSKYKVKVT